MGKNHRGSLSTDQSRGMGDGRGGRRRQSHSQFDCFQLGDSFGHVQKIRRGHLCFRMTQDCRRLQETARTTSCVPPRCICAISHDDWIFHNYALISNNRAIVGTGQYLVYQYNECNGMTTFTEFMTRLACEWPCAFYWGP